MLGSHIDEQSGHVGGGQVDGSQTVEQSGHCGQVKGSQTVQVSVLPGSA